MESFEGKVALVTGASSGIGRASAEAFARNGSAVVVVDVNAEGGRETVRRIEGLGARAIFVHADVADSDEVHEAVLATLSNFGRLDFAHNNAGIIGGGGPIADISEEVWARTLQVNLDGVFFCMKHEIPAMLDSGGGAIVNTSSRAGLVGVGGIAAYVASKHAIGGLTKVGAIEYSKLGIRVNAVCPGPIETGMSTTPSGALHPDAAGIVAGRPMARYGKPHEVAEAVIWLCSDSASFVTGHLMAVDGGSVAQ